MAQRGINKKQVSKWLARLIRENNYVPARISIAAGVSSHTFGAFLDGSEAPTEDQLKRICILAGEDFDRLREKFGYVPSPKHGGQKDIALPSREKTELAEESSEEKVPEDDISHPADMKKVFGRWFTHLMDDSGCTAAEYAELAGVSVSTVRRYRTGTFVPALNILQNICRLHNLDWKVPACCFGYPSFLDPEKHLGPDYKSNPVWIDIENIRKQVQKEEEAADKAEPVPAAAADVPASAGTSRETEDALSSENAKLKAQVDELLKTVQTLDSDLKMEKKAKFEAESMFRRSETLRQTCCGEIEDIRKRYDRMCEEFNEMKQDACEERSDIYASRIEEELKKLLPNAEAVSVACPDGNMITWTVSLPGMKQAFFGNLADAGTAALAIQEKVKADAMKRLGF